MEHDFILKRVPSRLTIEPRRSNFWHCTLISRAQQGALCDGNDTTHTNETSMDASYFLLSRKSSLGMVAGVETGCSVLQIMHVLGPFFLLVCVPICQRNGIMFHRHVMGSFPYKMKRK